MIIGCNFNDLQCAICKFEDICNKNELSMDYDIYGFVPATKQQLEERLKSNQNTKRNEIISCVLKYKVSD